VILNTAIVRPFERRNAPPFVIVLVLFGFAGFTSALLSIIFSSNAFAFSITGSLRNSVHIAGMLFTVSQLVVILLGFALVLGVDLALRLTSLGRDFRAIADDRELARVKGVRDGLITNIAWWGSGFLGGLAGVSIALIQVSFSTKSDQGYFVLVVAAAFLGGAGKAYGALLGALLVGISTEIAAIWISPNLTSLIAFVALVVVIVVRPDGILSGTTERIRA
jgi:branched-subunit amino acid ABC-type transport system permease component